MAWMQTVLDQSAFSSRLRAIFLTEDSIRGWLFARLPFPTGPRPCGVRVPASVALLLASGCREVCPGRPGPASWPPSLSFTRMVLSLILRTGLRVGPNRSSPTPEQAWRNNRLAAGAVPVGRATRAVGTTILVGLKGLPRLSSHKIQSHCNVQAHCRC